MMTYLNKTFAMKALLFAAVLTLAGCGPIIDTGAGDAPDNIYDLEPMAAANADGVADKTLFFERITYPAFINTVRILVRPRDQEIQYLAGARWSDKAPALISRFLVISLDSANGLMVINRDHPALDHDYKVVIDVRDFSAHIPGDGIPEIVVSFNVDLMKTDPLEVVSRKTFTRTIKATDNTRDSIVQAFQAGMEGIAADLENWINAASQ